MPESRSIGGIILVMTEAEVWHKKHLARMNRVYHTAKRNQRLYLSGRIGLAEMRRRHEAMMAAAKAEANG